MDEVRDTRYYIPYRLAVYGLRRGEICAITALDISDANILTVNKDKVYNSEKKWVIKPYPKTTDSQRTIYIDDGLRFLRENVLTNKKSPENRIKPRILGLFLAVPAVGPEPTTDTL